MKSRLFPNTLYALAAVVALALAGAGVHRMWAQAIAPIQPAASAGHHTASEERTR
ncbi:hypothetical protein [Cupriavidus agavae]|uniref:Uncharacterized protein n=1 Tax=Cupriavidus agavae TaxID=1001822 RepID=A0A4Q7S2V2_9BURK|nr:hypothetical protein [Cupriavidus agavae]RZT39510.1 hypothetical protein EV147_2705 [Cupriavidus agavae]